MGRTSYEYGVYTHVCLCAGNRSVNVNQVRYAQAIHMHACALANTDATAHMHNDQCVRESPLWLSMLTTSIQAQSVDKPDRESTRLYGVKTPCIKGALQDQPEASQGLPTMKRARRATHRRRNDNAARKPKKCCGYPPCLSAGEDPKAWEADVQATVPMPRSIVPIRAICGTWGKRGRLRPAFGCHASWVPSPLRGVPCGHELGTWRPPPSASLPFAPRFGNAWRRHRHNAPRYDRYASAAEMAIRCQHVRSTKIWRETIRELRGACSERCCRAPTPRHMARARDHNGERAKRAGASF